MDERERAEQVELASGGDADALQRLIVHYHATWEGVLASAIEPELRRHVDPDDVLQRAYVAAFKSVGGCSFEGPGGFYKWLETIALNQLKDMRRDLRRDRRDVGREIHEQRTVTSSYPALLAGVASPDSTPSRHLAKAEATAAVMSCLARLTDDQRQIVTMRFLESRPIAEIATELGKTEAAVHMLCHRALKALRDLMVSISRYL